MNLNKNYIGAGLVALAFIGVWGWVLPEYNKISDLNFAINERQVLYASRSATIKRIQDLNKEYQQKSADIARISSLLPSKKSLAEAVSALDKMAIQSGLQLTNATIAGEESKNQTTGNYNFMPIETSITGSYLGLVSFLQSIEKNLRIIDVISVDAASGTGDKANLLTFSVKGNAYYLK